MWEEIFSHVLNWVPAILAVSIGLIIIALSARWMQSRHEKNKVESSLGVIGPLISSALVAITLVAIALTLPIGESARGELLGLLGLLVTAAIALSSTTFLGNAMAGVMLRAIGSFRAGDFVRIGEHLGRVSDRGILHTEIQTPDRDLTTLPNLYMITQPLTVLSSCGTVVSATISLGYDVAHVLVEQHLLEAAKRAGLTDPFVQVVELGDFSISYRAAGFLDEVSHLLTTRSNLRKAMLDCLHAAKIEIVSPNFVNLRRLAEREAVLPEQIKNPPVLDEKPPEARIFDKAEAALEKDKVREELEAQKALVESLTQKASSSDFVAEKADLDDQLANAKARLLGLEAIVKNSES